MYIIKKKIFLYMSMVLDVKYGFIFEFIIYIWWCFDVSEIILIEYEIKINIDKVYISYGVIIVII